MPHPQLLQRVDKRRPRQHRQVREPPSRRVRRQELRDTRVAARRLEQRREVDPRQDEVELRARVASGQDLEDARALPRKRASDAGEGLRGGERHAAVAGDGRRSGVERGDFALGLGAAARERVRAVGSSSASPSTSTSAGADARRVGSLADGEAGEVDGLLDLVLDV